MKKERIPLVAARNRLLFVWLAGSALPAIIIIVQLIIGRKYDGNEEQVMGWFSPLVFPTITLMIGIVGASALAAVSSEKKTVSRFFLNASVWLSVTHLLVVTLVIVLEPISTKPVIEHYTKSNLFITPIQGLAMAAIGVLFATTKED